jgi:membrane-bound lytic murein transglycosylase A
MRLRGRLDPTTRRVIPYYDRAQIDSGVAGLSNKVIVWVDDPIDLFFLQIQGSGRVKLDNGDTLRLGYADQNGYPYRAIGRHLVELGELPLDKASLDGIKNWAKEHPDKLSALLDYNASYVFFRKMPDTAGGPLGALGVPLTAERSIAVDARVVPLGAPVFLATTWPASPKPLKQLMFAQDTGGAIHGGVRADFFWGFGDDAARHAGNMRQMGKMWVLLPNGDVPPPATLKP